MESFLTEAVVLVTGGSGGLASQMLKVFSDRGCRKLHSIDLRPALRPQAAVTYHQCDLTDRTAIDHLFHQIRPEVIIHTASPRFDAPRTILHEVNINGTELLVDMAKSHGTTVLVYTSSASVISDGVTDLRNADEEYPLILDDRQPEYYTLTKGLAERFVLSQNRRADKDQPAFLTCAIRPSGIFGVGDQTLLPGLLNAYYSGRTKVQLGDSENLFDFTESSNVAHAHHLAATALLRCTRQPPDEEHKVDGEAFFVTNDEPRPFWDFARLVWRYAGDTTRSDQITVIPRTWAMVLAGVLEWTFWLFRLGDPPLTRTRVRLSCMTRYFCIEKAKSRLQYRPIVGLEDGLKTAVEDVVRELGRVAS